MTVGSPVESGAGTPRRLLRIVTRSGESMLSGVPVGGAGRGGGGTVTPRQWQEGKVALARFSQVLPSRTPSGGMES